MVTNSSIIVLSCKSHNSTITNTHNSTITNSNIIPTAVLLLPIVIYAPVRATDFRVINPNFDSYSCGEYTTKIVYKSSIILHYFQLIAVFTYSRIVRASC